MVDFIGLDNNSIYVKTLLDLIKNPISVYDKGEVSHEIIGFNRWFYPTGIIEGINEVYAKNEIDWYMSQDNSIKGHSGIASNPTWIKCASDDGKVNSNYGWCTMSDDNKNQLDEVIKHFKSDKKTRQAIMVYTRPAIHKEAVDNIHAKYDMTCTCYVCYIIRDNKLYSLVHMRSNDVWYGLRYDLIWQQKILDIVYSELISDTNFSDLKLGGIKWNADSLHLYSKHLKAVAKYLESQNVKL